MADRNKLMQEITFGLKLRPTKTLDRSQPIIHADGETFKKYNSVSDSQLEENNPPYPSQPPPPPPPPLLLNGHENMSSAKKSWSNSLTSNQSTEKPKQKSVPQQNGSSCSREALLNQIKTGQFKLKPVQVIDKTAFKPAEQDSYNVFVGAKDMQDSNESSFAQEKIQANKPSSAQALMGQLQETLAKRFVSSQQPSEIVIIEKPMVPLPNKDPEQLLVIEPMYKTSDDNLVELDEPDLKPELIAEVKSGLEEDGENLFYCQPATSTDFANEVFTQQEPEKIVENVEYESGLQTPKLLRSFEPVFRSSVDDEPTDDEERAHLKSASLLAKILKEKMEKNPQPVYPLKKPSTSENDQLKEIFHLASLLSQPSKIIDPPSMPPPPVPTSYEEPDKKVETGRQSSKYNFNGTQVVDENKPTHDKIVTLPKMANVEHNESQAPASKLNESQAPVTNTFVKSQHNYTAAAVPNGSNLHSVTLAKPREHVVEVKQLPSSPISNGTSSLGQKTEEPQQIKSVEQIVNKFQNGNDGNSQNGFACNGNGIHVARVVQPRERIIEIKRLPSNQPFYHQQNGHSEKDNVNNYGSKTLPRNIHNGKAINDGDMKPKSFHTNGFAAHPSLSQVESDQHPSCIRHNSDPNLLDIDDNNGVALSETGMFRKVFPNVSQLRNRFEYKSDDASSTKSSPTAEHFPSSQMFVCKPAVAIPIPPSSGPQLSIATKFDDRSGPTKHDIVRKMSSASDSSFSSSDMMSPKSVGSNKKESQTNKFGDVRSSNESVNSFTNMSSKISSRSRGESVTPGSVFTAQPAMPVGMGHINAGNTVRKSSERQLLSHFDDQGRRGSAPAVSNVPLTTWKVKKESIPQTVNKYPIAKTLEEMHHRQMDSMNGSDIAGRQVVNGIIFDDKFDTEVANLMGMSLEDLKQFRFQIDLSDPEGTFLQLQKKLYQQQH